MEIQVTSNCIHCSLCTEICPAHLFIWSPEGSAEHEPSDVPIVPHPEACIQCGHCVCLCPADAIEHSAFPPEAKLPIPEDPLPSWENFHQLASTRRSVRKFQHAPVPRKQIAQILQTAETAPTACNGRHVHWTAVSDPEILHQIRQETLSVLRKGLALLESPFGFLAAKLFPRSSAGRNYDRIPMMRSLLKASETQDLILYDAPALLAAHCSVKGSPFAQGDAQLALQNAALAAHALGLGSFYVGFVTWATQENPAIGKLLQLPKDHQLAGGLAVGIPAVQYRFAPVREFPEIRWLD
ncbi:MAG: nitroreductase family protein [Thermoguttaceae bacterium]|nr:nitroreductase family protein [Thermoguttaceae bacterium]